MAILRRHVEQKHFQYRNRHIMREIVLKRLVVYPKDIERITGKKERTARKYLQEIKAKLGKSKTDLVSIDEFCEVTGFKLEKVAVYLVD